MLVGTVNVATRQLVMTGALIALLASVVAAGVAMARPDDLDPTFGDGGRVFVDVANDSGGFRAPAATRRSCGRIK